MRAVRALPGVAPPPAPATPPRPAPGSPPAPASRRAVRRGEAWLARAGWVLGRTGPAGLAGIALLLGAALFYASTVRPVAAEVLALRADLSASRRSAPRTGAGEGAPAGAALPPLPARGELPAVVGQLFAEAARARLAVDTARYELQATKGSRLVRYRIAFPVAGPYPRIRAFIDAALAAIPAAALGDLALERRSVGDADVEAQLRMTVFAVDAESAAANPGAPLAAGDGPGSGRVVAPAHDAALFARRSWYVAPPPRPEPPPPPPPPPPDPTAPPLPYAFVGRYAPGGDPPVFFLARGDRVIQARIGDRLDGVYRLDGAAPGQLVFVYLPLDTRQILKAGESK